MWPLLCALCTVQFSGLKSELRPRPIHPSILSFMPLAIYLTCSHLVHLFVQLPLNMFEKPLLLWLISLSQPPAPQDPVQTGHGFFLLIVHKDYRREKKAIEGRWIVDGGSGQVSSTWFGFWVRVCWSWPQCPDFGQLCSCSNQWTAGEFTAQCAGKITGGSIKYTRECACRAFHTQSFALLVLGKSFLLICCQLARFLKQLANCW